ncbi:hypothetical protein HID58_030040 [Brassica napus]|uniref:Uncharacterized protein n=1 Tax=Brassica napus TaxID=3708 RepID=A0ABQ8CES8_BRANA|nr:hypothetical protein HID58_030040 [Brassica napus]
MLYAYKVAQVNKNFLCLVRFAKINVYKGQVQVTNAFDSSTVEINPPGFDVQDYLQVPSMKRMKRKHQPRFEDDGHRLRSQSVSKQRIDHSQRKDVPLSTVFGRLKSDITNNRVSSRFKTQVSVSNPTNKRVCFDKKNDENPNDKKKSRRDQGIVRGSCSSHVTFQRENTPNTKIPITSTSHTTFDSGISNTSYVEHDFPIDDPENEDLLRSIDECDDLEVECSSQESSDTEISDDEQSVVQEPQKEDQTERVSFLAALFKKNFSEVKKPPKPKVKAVSSSEYED